MSFSSSLENITSDPAFVPVKASWQRSTLVVLQHLSKAKHANKTTQLPCLCKVNPLRFPGQCRILSFGRYGIRLWSKSIVPNLASTCPSKEICQDLKYSSAHVALSMKKYKIIFYWWWVGWFTTLFHTEMSPASINSHISGISCVPFSKLDNLIIIRAPPIFGLLLLANIGLLQICQSWRICSPTCHRIKPVLKVRKILGPVI